MMKKCKNCGAELADNDFFCGECGTKTDRVAEFIDSASEKSEKLIAEAKNIGEKVGAGIDGQINRLAPKLSSSYERIKEMASQIGGDNTNNTESGTASTQVAGSVSASVANDDATKYADYYEGMDRSNKMLKYLMIPAIIYAAYVALTHDSNARAVSDAADNGGFSIIGTIITLATVAAVGYYLWRYVKTRQVKKHAKAVGAKLGRMYLTLMGVILITMLLPPVGLVLMGYTIYKNYQRRKFLERYRRYTVCRVKGLLLNCLCMLGFAVWGLAAYAGNAGAVFVIELIGAVIVVVSLRWMNSVSKKFYQGEQARNVQFEECGRLLKVVPLVWILLLISVTTLMENPLFSGDKLIADVGLDVDTSAMGDAPTAMARESIVTEPIATNTAAIGLESTPEVFGSSESTVVGPQTDAVVPVDNLAINEPIIASASDSVATNTNTQTNVAVPQRVNIMDANGMSVGSVKQMGDTTTLHDTMEQTVATAKTDSLGNTTIQGADGLTDATITHDGVVKGADGLTDATVTADGTVKDAQNQTMYHIKDLGDGKQIILDAQGHFIGEVKK